MYSTNISIRARSVSDDGTREGRIRRIGVSWDKLNLTELIIVTCCAVIHFSKSTNNVNVTKIYRGLILTKQNKLNLTQKQSKKKINS